MNEFVKTGLRVLIVHDGLPHFDRSGADMRLMQVIHSLLRQQCHLTFIGRNGINHEKYAPVLEKLGIKVFFNDAQNLRYGGIDIEPVWSLQEVLHNGEFDVAILCLWFGGKISVPEQYLTEIRRVSPTTRVIVLTDDRHGFRERRMAKLTGSIADEERANDFEQREIEICSQTDLICAISEEDKNGLLALAPELQIELLPMVADECSVGPGFAERWDILFVGNFDNPANREGFHWFLRDVWPKLRKRFPDLQVSAVGSNPLPEWKLVPGVVITGPVPHLTPYLEQHRVFISPIRVGTGIKTKNIVALAHGLPLVSTTIGGEGMKLKHGREAWIADTPADFAEGVACLYADENLWRSFHETGWRHIRQEFSLEKLDLQTENLLPTVQNIKPKTPDPNFCFSIRNVESAFPEVLTHVPEEERLYVRMIKHLELADELLAKNLPKAALEQMRHTFALFPTTNPGGTFFAAVFDAMARCYQKLGDRERAKRCLRLSKTCAARSHSKPEQKKKHGKKSRSSQSIVRGTRGQASIALCMIARNAAKDLPICLESVKGVVQEIIVADTGSTDETSEVVKKLGARVLAVPWQNDFAQARNATLAAVNSDWVLVLDSDEELDPAAAQILLSLVRSQEFDGYRIPLRHYVWDAGLRGWDQRARRNDGIFVRAQKYPAYVQQEIVRLFRRSPDIYFEGRVHEMVDRSILRSGGKIGDAPFCIHHYGHVAAAATLSQKNELYRELGRLKIKDLPNDAHAHLELGLQEMDNFQNYLEALRCFDRACQLEPQNGSAWLFAGMAAARLGQFAEALERLKRVPLNGRSAVLLAETQGEIFFNLKDYESAANSYRRAWRLCPEDALLESKTGLCELRSGHVESGLKKLRHAVETTPEVSDLYDLLLAALVSVERFEEAANVAEVRIQRIQPTQEAFLKAASIRAHMGKWQQAADLLEQGVRKFPASQKLQTALAEQRVLSAR